MIMKTTEDLFRESIEQYNTLIKKADFLSKNMVSMSPDDILKKCEELGTLQATQAKADSFIVEIMHDTGPKILEQPYTGEYQRMLDKAMLACNKVAAKAQTIRTLLQTEMNKLKKGQQCLAGYGSFGTEDSNLKKHSA